MIIRGYVVPGFPQPLLSPDAHPGYGRLRAAYEQVGEAIAATEADLLVLYSTRWPSVIGHQIQADPEPVWEHVDEEFHELGSIPYQFRIDADFATRWRDAARARGLHTRTVAYHGFPIDTGTVVALTLLNPDNRLPATVVSCNMYADRAETLVLGKSAADAVAGGERKAVAVAITALSNRMFTEWIDPADDRISSTKDDEWNRKLLEFFEEGRLEDVSQLARTFTAQANGDSRGKAFWWLAAAMGQNNDYGGRVLAYEALHGTGGAVIELVPGADPARDQEFDEDDVEVFSGDRNVLDAEPSEPDSAPLEDAAAPFAPLGGTPTLASGDGSIATDTAPDPVGPYPHARRVGDLLYLSGMGPRQPGDDAIPGGPIRDDDGPRNYDVKAQTRAVIENIARVLEAAGSSLDQVVDVTCFLVDMDRDFDDFNAVYTEHFGDIRPTRTTVSVRALPTPIAVELKVVALP